jgi:hypothetical protein
MDQSQKLAKLLITWDKLNRDYKRSGCGTCKRVANELYLELLNLANVINDENENKTRVK